ncbi:uncharacterized protein ASPGLDRAFT_317237 [Aspergillus glaucus CBS 516.65]|uniref:Uncharacterized protein n=1 Tax=Aspergillus glaucus CBS 516.65 TaxID=1160497 RepID=A0A1L9VK62_ASPGL|nr:hypothetical protein ASPGLDRAFT_317237 [Aspergillus glaucus CBS 516.65]OJJ84297.1 hypothetical protein ASPGLDRAFT_317237 [Aspergillus glaucus CBS 516.65]
MSEVQSDNPENETSGNWRFASHQIPYGNCTSSRCTAIRNMNAYSYSGFLFGGSKPHIPRIWSGPGCYRDTWVFSGVVIMYRFLGCVLVFM